jgi:hypothetical protein
MQVSVQNHDFFLQYAVQTERSIGELKTFVEALNKSSERQADRLDKVLEELHDARGAFATIKWIGGIWGTLILLVVSTALTVLLKHFKLV